MMKMRKILIDSPIHQDGHTLDHLLVPKDCNIEFTNPEQGYKISDHHFVMTKMSYKKAQVHRERIKYPCFKAVSREMWESELKDLIEQTGEISDIEELVEYCNKGMSEIEDKVVPVKYKVCTVRSKPEWIDSDSTERRRLTRKHERKYRKNKTNHNKDIYVGLQKEYRYRLRWNRKKTC